MSEGNSEEGSDALKTEWLCTRGDAEMQECAEMQGSKTQHLLLLSRFVVPTTVSPDARTLQDVGITVSPDAPNQEDTGITVSPIPQHTGITVSPTAQDTSITVSPTPSDHTNIYDGILTVPNSPSIVAAYTRTMDDTVLHFMAETHSTKGNHVYPSQSTHADNVFDLPAVQNHPWL
ncbi:hypothetical protein DEU56DRAFT_911430 [Suillus clintonianus]|uniref:uncharacterized protein n=1 Tax=Suillus clintonianus TaxID=1904413 RepID=UPI001B87EB5F|nr:uncharacterized protein DEU56DRAFT_911430 [Suillus clintonianus]KAG2141317.1 hypothetical protein DEU56DRAFT_911430 [Suillus clintonianus]